jgi:Protein of unknown function (DUF3891)
MIVNHTKDGWETIYHRAHALLAAQLGGHWRRADAPERFYETLAAISHHDDLEREWQGNQLTKTGAPLDFTLGDVELEESLAKTKQHLEEARYRGRWVTMMTSMHACYLSQANRAQSQDWSDFLDEQLKNQARWRKELGITKDEAERAYQFMQWCDRLSLILAQRQVPEDGRALEITHGIDGQRYDLRCLENGCLTVEPWPFQDDEFTVNVEAANLDRLKFESDAELVTALKQAPISQLEWTFTNQS